MAYTYNPKEVSINVLGYEIEGWVSCTVDRDEDETAEQRGADGTLSTTINSNEGGMINLEVLQEAEANAFVEGLSRIRQSTGALPKFVFQVVDPSGGVLETMEGVYLKRAAGSSVAATAGTKTHVFYAEKILKLPVPEGYADAASKLANVEALLGSLG